VTALAADPHRGFFGYQPKRQWQQV